ncbi:MAG: NAD(P)/FAD-dependent oxidoreductase [Candidatus Omnitrophica bacterium]|nr:NAD(P)/FAD-dependent oxidoreductase [Candidatus Omnitrophota bacterium]
MNIIVETFIKPNIESESKKFIAPHFPGGVLTSADLRKIADVCEKFPENKLKINGDLTIGGITNPKRNDECRQSLGLPTYSVAGFSIRPVKVCAGGYMCDNNLQDSFSLGLKLDKMFSGKPVPFKLIISVSGCPRGCSEPLVKDIGIISARNGYSVHVGGAAGGKPRIAQKIAEKLNEEQVMALVEKIVTFYELRGKTMERLGVLIDRVGMENFKATIVSGS